MKRKGSQLLKIGELARLMDLQAQTIRNYEQQGLLTPLTRSEAGHRLYGQLFASPATAMSRPQPVRSGPGSTRPASTGMEKVPWAA